MKAEVVPGLEPKQRIPEARPSGFAGREHRGDFQSRDRKFGAGNRNGGFDAARPGFADRNASGPRVVNPGSYYNNSNSGFAGRDERPAALREGFSYERKGGFNDRFAGERNATAAPRGDFAARKPAFGKPAFAKPAGGGKVFVPRDAQKRFAKTER